MKTKIAMLTIVGGLATAPFSFAGDCGDCTVDEWLKWGAQEYVCQPKYGINRGKAYHRCIEDEFKKQKHAWTKAGWTDKDQYLMESCGLWEPKRSEVVRCYQQHNKDKIPKYDDQYRRIQDRVDYICKGKRDRKPYPVRLDLGNKTLTWFNFKFSDVRQVECDAMACFRGTNQDLVATLSTGTQGWAAFEIQTKFGPSVFECQQQNP